MCKARTRAVARADLGLYERAGVEETDSMGSTEDGRGEKKTFGGGLLGTRYLVKRLP